MRLHSLRLTNFRQHLDTTLAFEPGLTGIIGPNGSGKTTVLEAIAWALYGMDAARGKRDSIRSFRAKPRATVRVELDFALGSHRFRVVRGLTSAELYLDGAETPIANSITTVNDLLSRRLGMTLEEFFNTYFTGQKELSVMAAMGPAERAQFLSRVLGYERLRTAQDLLRARRRDILAEVTGLKGAMPDPEVVATARAEAAKRFAVAEAGARTAASRRVDAGRALDDLTPRWEAFQRDRDRLHALIGEQRVLDGEAAGLHRDLTRIAKESEEIDAARVALSGIQQEVSALDGLRAQVTELERQARDEGRRQALKETDRTLVDALARLAERRARIGTAPQLEKEATTELDRQRVELTLAEQRLEKARTEWVRDAQEAETKVEQLKRQLQELREQRDQLIKLGEEGMCPICSRPLGDHYRKVLDWVDEQSEAVTVEGRYYRSRIEQLRKPPDDVTTLDEQRRQLHDLVSKLERRLLKVQLAIQELAGVDREAAETETRRAEIARHLDEVPGTYDADRHATVRRELERILPLEAQATRLGALIERAPHLSAERSAIDGRLTAIVTTLASLSQERVRLNVTDDSLDALRVQYERAASEFRTAELAAVAADAERGSARGALDVAERACDDLARTQQKLTALGRDRRLHDELDRAYSEMRVELNQQLRPEISALASQFLSELTDGRYTELELDAGYNITVLEDGLPKPVISGGEEDLANLVLRLAISQMIAERAGQPLSLLILDEVFGSLDESRRQNVVDLLRRLQDSFEQVILISHIESVRQDLDHIMTVRYDDEAGTSTVEGGWVPSLASALDSAEDVFG